MPLSEPVAREVLHTRRIVLQGYHRADGLFDIEAQLTDTKTNGFSSEDRGFIEPGEPLHGMSIRVTIDREMNIKGVVAVTDYSPYRMCSAITPNFQKIIGLNLGRGFRKAAPSPSGPV